jgi:hypothetical protein
MTPPLLPILAADFRIGSGKVFGFRFQNQQWHILAFYF